MDIHLLSVKIVTNIPNSKEFELTRSMIYHPDYKNMSSTGTYPYITGSIDYSDTNISTLTYPEIVEIFFNKSRFINMLSKATKSNMNVDLEKNVMTMLRLLFPTKYFAVNNHKQSITLLEPQAVKQDSSSWFYNPFNTLSSYLKLNGQSYTVTKAWLVDDAVNQPLYRKLLTEVYIMNRALNKYRTDITLKLTRFHQTLIERIDSIIESINEAIASGTQKTTKTTYHAKFAIIYLKQLITNTEKQKATPENINTEVRKENFTYPKALIDIDYNPIKTTTTNDAMVLADEEDPIELQIAPIRLKRLDLVLNLMKDPTHKLLLSNMIKNSTNIKQPAVYEQNIDKLFSTSFITEGLTYVKELQSVTNIDFSRRQGSSEAPIISAFKTNVLYKYKRPNLTSENKNLQDYIDAETPERANELIKKFDEIYRFYILKDKTVTINKEITDLLPLNVSNINLDTSDNTKPTKQIYVKLVVIDGEVNDTNKSDIYCPITNDKLGNELLELVYHTTDPANLLEEDTTIFTVKTKKTSNGYKNQLQNIQNTALNPNVPVKYAPANVPNQNKPPVKYTEDVYQRFGSIILRDANLRDLQSIIDEIRKTPSMSIDMNPESILNFILSSYTNANKSTSDDYTKLPDLPSIVTKWSESTTRKNTQLEESMVAMQYILDGQKDIIDRTINGSKRIVGQAEKGKLLSQLSVISLYKFIVNALLTNEKKKQIVTRGGKTSKKKHCYTSNIRTRSSKRR